MSPTRCCGACDPAARGARESVSRGAGRARRSDSMAMITVQYASRVRGLPTAAQVRRWARAAIAGAGAGDAQLNFRLVNGAEGRRLNRQFRGRDYATNVLTFAYDDDGAAPCADIVLCAQVVAREAHAQAKARAAHYAHLVVHGTLHALGHDHTKAAQARRMEALETAILGGLGFPAPY